MSIIRFYSIEWDIEQDVDPKYFICLPNELCVRCDDVENITEEELEDILADNSDYLFKRFNYEIIDADDIIDADEITL